MNLSLAPQFSYLASSFSEALLQNLNATIVFRTLEGQIIGWNEAAAQLYEYSANEILNQSISLIAPQAIHGNELRQTLEKKTKAFVEKRKKKMELKFGYLLLFHRLKMNKE